MTPPPFFMKPFRKVDFFWMMVSLSSCVFNHHQWFITVCVSFLVRASCEGAAACWPPPPKKARSLRAKFRASAWPPFHVPFTSQPGRPPLCGHHILLCNLFYSTSSWNIHWHNLRLSLCKFPEMVLIFVILAHTHQLEGHQCYEHQALHGFTVALHLLSLKQIHIYFKNKIHS